MSCKLRKYFGARTMPNLKTIVEAARETMKNDAVILTAVEYRNRRATRFQVYFWDEHQAVMDIISRNDLLENWPDAGVYLLDTAATDPDDVLRPVRRFEGEEEIFLRTSDEDAEADELGTLPTVLFMEAVEAICALKDEIKL